MKEASARSSGRELIAHAELDPALGHLAGIGVGKHHGPATVRQRGQRRGAGDGGAGYHTAVARLQSGNRRPQRCRLGRGKLSALLQLLDPLIQGGEVAGNVDPAVGELERRIGGVHAGQEIGDEVLQLVDVEVGGEIERIGDAPLVAQLPPGHRLHVQVRVAQCQRLGRGREVPRQRRMQGEARERGRREACLDLSVVLLDSAFDRRRTRGRRGGGSLKKELGVVRRLERAVHREAERVILVGAVDQARPWERTGSRTGPVVHPGRAHHPELGGELVLDLAVAGVVIVAPVVVDRVHQRARGVDPGVPVGRAVHHPAALLQEVPVVLALDVEDVGPLLELSAAGESDLRVQRGPAVPVAEDVGAVGGQGSPGVGLDRLQDLHPADAGDEHLVLHL